MASRHHRILCRSAGHHRAGQRCGGLGICVQGSRGYSAHRQDYLIANGYTDLDASHAIASGIGVIQRQGDLANKIIMDYGNNFTSSYTAQDTNSQAEYGLFAEQFSSYLKNAGDVEDVADRLIGLRAWPKFFLRVPSGSFTGLIAPAISLPK